MAENCIFQKIEGGEMYCKIWTNELGQDTASGMTTKEICKVCPVPEVPCRRLSVRVSIFRALGSEGEFNGYIAMCEKKKEKIRLPNDCDNCPDYVS